MKKLLLFLLFVTLSCKQSITDADINLVNGYWQIEKVIDDNGNKKEYKINEIYDYFELKNKVGIHKKVKWQPAAKFLVNDAQENVKVIKEAESYYLKFWSQNGTHLDKLESISDEEMVLVSKEKVSFYYTKVNLDASN